VLIATGARPATLDIPGEELLTSSAGFLDLDELPPRIVFVGGGYIAFEFAHLAVRAGAEVTVLHRGERPLERFEPELVDRLAAVTREVGIDLRVEHDVAAVERSDDGLKVRASTPDGSRVFDGDLVVHAAAGRRRSTIWTWMRQASSAASGACGWTDTSEACRTGPYTPRATQPTRTGCRSPLLPAMKVRLRRRTWCSGSAAR
jgi:hypothetical protein